MNAPTESKNTAFVRYNAPETLLRSLVACSAGKAAFDADFGRNLHNALLKAAEANGFSRGRELRALIYKARKLAQEAAQLIEPEEAQRVIDEHNATAETGRATLLELTESELAHIGSSGDRYPDEKICKLLARIDDTEGLRHESRMLIAAVVAELATREWLGNQNNQSAQIEFENIVQCSIERGKAGERFSDGDLSDAIRWLNYRYSFDDYPRHVMAAIVAEMAIRQRDLDWADGVIESINTRRGD